MAIAFFCLRLLLVPLVDLGGRSAVAAAAAAKLDIVPSGGSLAWPTGASLQLPWVGIMSGTESELPARLFDPARAGNVAAGEFRHYYTSYFLRWLVLWTWWVGALLGGVLIYTYGGGLAEVPWGIVAGAVAGVAGSVTLGSLFLVVEIVPQALWGLLFAGHASGPAMLALWVFGVPLCWAACGALAGLFLVPVASCRRRLLRPVQKGVATLCRWCGLRRLEHLCGV